MKSFSIFFAILFCGFAHAVQDPIPIVYEYNYEFHEIDFRDTVRETEYKSFSPASGSCATGVNIQDCAEIFQYNIAALQGIASSLGTAAFVDVPSSGDAASGQAVRGNDSRLTDARAPTAHSQTISTISDSTVVGRAVVTATDAAAARSAIGAYPSGSNPAGYLTGIDSSAVTTALGFTPYNTTNPNGFITSSALSPYLASATAATTYQPLDGDLTALAGISGSNILVYRSGSNAWNSVSIGSGLSFSAGTLAATGGTGTVTSVGISSSTVTVSGSPITGSGTITVNLNSVVSAGSCNAGVTVDIYGRVTACFNRSINDNPGRSLVTSTSATGFQISSTRDARVCYEGSISTTSTIGGPASAVVYLETAATNSTTPGDWTIKAQQQSSQTITLAVALQSVDGEAWSICRTIQAGLYVRLRYTTSGTASVSLNSTQQEETL